MRHSDMTRWPALARVIYHDDCDGVLFDLAVDRVPMAYAESLAETALGSDAPEWQKWHMGIDFARVAREYYEAGLDPEDFHPSIPAVDAVKLRDEGYSVQTLGAYAMQKKKDGAVLAVDVLAMPPRFAHLLPKCDIHPVEMTTLYNWGYDEPEDGCEQGKSFLPGLVKLAREGRDMKRSVALAKLLPLRLVRAALDLDVTDAEADATNELGKPPLKPDDLRIDVLTIRHPDLPVEYIRAMANV